MAKSVKIDFMAGTSLADAVDLRPVRGAVLKSARDLHAHATALVVEYAFDTGRLAASLEVAPDDAFEYVLYSEVEYAGFVHDGYVHSSGRVMAGKPFFVWALEDRADQIERALDAAIAKGVRMKTKRRR